MWNGEEYGTLDLIDRFMSALRAMAPLGTLDRIEYERTDGPPWDAVIRWHVGSTSLNVGIVVRVRSVRVVSTLRDPVDASITPVMVSPFISPTARRELERRGWSYWDPTGNVSITSETPFVAIRTEGATKDPDPLPSPPAKLSSLKGRAASEVIVGLLQNDGRAASIREFAREHALPLGTVSRVVSLLRDENLVEPTGGGPIVLTDRLETARRWTEDYSFAKSFRARRYRSLSGPEVGLSHIVDSGLQYAITGVRAAQNWLEGTNTPNAFPATETWIYVSDLSRVERAADLAQDSRNGQFLIAECGFLGREGSRRVGPYDYVVPWRIAGDLMSASGRVAGVGERVAVDLITSQR